MTVMNIHLISTVGCPLLEKPEITKIKNKISTHLQVTDVYYLYQLFTKTHSWISPSRYKHFLFTYLSNRFFLMMSTLAFSYITTNNFEFGIQKPQTRNLIKIQLKSWFPNS